MNKWTKLVLIFALAFLVGIIAIGKSRTNMLGNRLENLTAAKTSLRSGLENGEIKAVVDKNKSAPSVKREALPASDTAMIKVPNVPIVPERQKDTFVNFNSDAFRAGVSPQNYLKKYLEQRGLDTSYLNQDSTLKPQAYEQYPKKVQPTAGQTPPQDIKEVLSSGESTAEIELPAGFTPDQVFKRYLEKTGMDERLLPSPEEWATKTKDIPAEAYPAGFQPPVYLNKEQKD